MPGCKFDHSKQLERIKSTNGSQVLRLMTIIIANQCIITNISITAAQNLDLPDPIQYSANNGPETFDTCESCASLVRSFDEGLERTIRGKHEGGDTHWEERNLKSYADSEIRLVEIQEMLCDELKKGKAHCLSIAEEAESYIEEWWFKHRKKNVRLHDFLCINKLKLCCPDETFGVTCQKCPSDCNRHGHCDGAGSRKGTGKCLCQPGYQGSECEQCGERFYKMRMDHSDGQDRFTCIPCHKACRDTCDGPSSANCTECGLGYLREPNTHLCADINECEIGPYGMLESNKLCPDGTFCVNTDGHYKCSDCHRVCSTCLGYGSDKCVTCAPDYEMDLERRCIHFSELSDTSVFPGIGQLSFLGMLTNPFLLTILIVVTRILRRVYDSWTGGEPVNREIVRRWDFLIIVGYLVFFCCQASNFKEMTRDKRSPANENEGDLLAQRVQRTETIGEL